MKPPNSVEEVWGSGIMEPSAFRAPGSEALHSVPSPSTFVTHGLQPCDVWDAEEDARANRVQKTLERLGEGEHNECLPKSASEFLRTARTSGLSQGEYGKVLK